jgi:DNA polymerase III subunit chi
MTEIRFYHLERSGPDQVLPALLTKALQTGKRVLIKTPDAAYAERLSEHLWTYDPNSFLPHGTAKDGFETDQPVFLSETAENKNNAEILFSLHDHEIPNLETYHMVCAIFDGRDEAALEAARARWKIYKDSNHTLTYWQQGEAGWEKKA